MKVPRTNLKRALIIVDVQRNFISKSNEKIIDNIVQLIQKAPYDLYINATFVAKPGSLWDKQQNWHSPEHDKPVVISPIAHELEGLNVIHTVKSTRSAFKGSEDLVKALEKNEIKEVHVVGTATHDCVLATAFEAFDYGYPVYVLEECCNAMNHPNRHELGLELLRYQNMTNNSCLAGTVNLDLA